MEPPPCILEARGISKAFPGVQALDRVDLSLTRGEVHALVGENGAGKSTLMRIFDGIYQPDAGEILVDGRAVRIEGPQQAIRCRGRHCGWHGGVWVR